MLEAYTYISKIIQENPLIAGIFSLWGVAIISFVLWKIPNAIREFFWNQCITQVSFTSANAGWSYLNEKQYASFLSWFGKTTWFAKWSRRLGLESVDKENAIGPGIGTHFMIYEKRPTFIWVEEIESTGTSVAKYRVTLRMLGRDQEKLRRLINEFLVNPRDPNKLDVYAFSEVWDYLCSVPKRELRSVITPDNLKHILVSKLDWFYKNGDWYAARGLNYKFTLLLYGIPGTGKTSLIKALASHFNCNLCILDLTLCTAKSLTKALVSVEPKSIVVLEDIDGCGAALSRDTLQTAPTNSVPNSTGAQSSGDVTLKLDLLNTAGLLNALDGVIVPTGTVIIMTTNYIDRLDKALLRKGRVDETFEIRKFGDAEIREYLDLMYPKCTLPDGKFKEIVSCNLQGLFLESPNNINILLEKLPREEREGQNVILD